MVRTSCLHAVALVSNPALTSGQDLFTVVPDSTLLCFVNSHLGFLIMFLLSLNYCIVSLRLLKSGMLVN